MYFDIVIQGFGPRNYLRMTIGG